MAHVPALRSALIELEAGEVRKPVRDVDALRRQVAEATDMRNFADHEPAMTMLPPVIRYLAGQQELAPELVESLYPAQVLLKRWDTSISNASGSLPSVLAPGSVVSPDGYGDSTPVTVR